MKTEIIRLANEYAYNLDNSTNKIDDIAAKETFKRGLNALFDKRIVSQQRELLIAFAHYSLENDLGNVVQHISKEVDDFLAIYSG